MNFLIQLVLLVASYLIQALVTPRQKVKPAALEEFDFPQVTEGTPQAVMFGDGWAQGWFVLWFGNLTTKKIKSGGKKG